MIAALTRFSLAAAMMAGSVAATAQPTRASAPVTPHATLLLERDWVLMNWALKQYDADGDRLISPAESQRAAAAFRQIADGDGDGRVTPYEYRSARAFILARY